MTARPVELVDIADDPGGAVIGSKAAGLVRMAAAGLPVPPGVVVPADAAEPDIERLASVIAGRFPGRRLAVRSSGTAEDLAEASYAGQYETVLDVSPESLDIISAVRRVRASATAAHSDGYQSGQVGDMAVLVMPMVEAVAAGIAFTRDPVTGDRVVVVEAVGGVADGLAAGILAGERWIVEAEAECRSDLGVLDARLATEVASLARRCEEVAGTPQDVEWAFDGDDVLVLQSRPITAVPERPVPPDAPVPPGPWQWDSSHSRVPSTRLTASVFTVGFEAGSRRLVEHFGLPLDHLRMRSIGGYLHIQPVPPIGKPGSAPPPPPVFRMAFRLVPALRRRARIAAAAVENRVDRELARQWDQEIRPQVEDELGRLVDVDLGSLDHSALAEEFSAAVARARTVFGWTMVTDPSYLLPTSDLLEFLAGRDLGDMATVTRLLAGASPSEVRVSLARLSTSMTDGARRVVGEGGPEALARLEAEDPDFAADYRRHLRVHGLRVFGYDLSNPTVLEDPLLELRVIAAGVLPGDPTAGATELANQIRERLTADDRPVFDRLLADARSALPIREAGEAVHARALGGVRSVALEIGRRMRASGHAERIDDVMALDVDEVTAWLARPGDVREVARRRRAQRRWAVGHPPDSDSSAGAPLPDPAGFPPSIRRVMRIFELIMAHDTTPEVTPAGTDGVPASPGRHTGPVRLVSSPADFHRILPGDVLVAPITASTWEIVFPTIGALVTEVGGQLSHPAIVAREYGLPAIVGCVGAMARFEDGQVVTVDGTTGTVTPVDVP